MFKKLDVVLKELIVVLIIAGLMRLFFDIDTGPLLTIICIIVLIIGVVAPFIMLINLEKNKEKYRNTPQEIEYKKRQLELEKKNRYEQIAITNIKGSKMRFRGVLMIIIALVINVFTGVYFKLDTVDENGYGSSEGLPAFLLILSMFMFVFGIAFIIQGWATLRDNKVLAKEMELNR